MFDWTDLEKLIKYQNKVFYVERNYTKNVFLQLKRTNNTIKLILDALSVHETRYQEDKTFIDVSISHKQRIV